MFEGSQHHDSGYFAPLQAGRRAVERIDQHRPHQLLGSGADQRGRSGAVDGVGSHGLPAAGADPGALRDAAQGGAERAAAELREPALRPGDDGADGRRCSRSTTPTTGPRSATCRDLEAMQFDDVREFFRTYYDPANASLVLAGDLATEDGFELAERYFGDMPAGPASGAGARRRPRSPASAGWCSRIGSSCRASIWRGTRRRCSRRRRRARSGRGSARQRQDRPPVPDARLRATASRWTSRPRSSRGRLSGFFVLAVTAAPGASLADVAARWTRR